MPLSGEQLSLPLDAVSLRAGDRVKFPLGEGTVYHVNGFVWVINPNGRTVTPFEFSEVQKLA